MGWHQTASMRQIQGETIEGQVLAIDDKEFIDCTLVDCVLEYSGRPVSFTRTHMRGCRYVFFGSARSTVHFLQGVGLLSNAPGEWSEFPDTIN